MKITCICPTYKRPKLLQNIVACFKAQTHDDRELIILDDAGQIRDCEGDKWRLISVHKRFPTLQQKFNALVTEADDGLIAVWEDDDIYLPDHLEVIADAHKEFGGAEFITPQTVYSNYGGKWNHEGASGRFHGSWAYTKAAWERVGGYKDVGLIFDQQLRVDIVKSGTPETKTTIPTYVYRWNNGVYHGSQLGAEGYDRLMQELENIRSEPVLNFFPEFDDYTIDILDELEYN